MITPLNAHPLRQTPSQSLTVGLAFSLATLASGQALAQTSESRRAGNDVNAANDTVVELPPIIVEGSPYTESYRANAASSSKFTAPLLDTPKTVTVITQKQIEERGLNSVTEVLRTTPGVTLGSGEGGTPLGDRPFVRGFEASTNMMIDGVRNVARTNYEAFNLEAVEISKGPGGAYDGRGTTGGSINMVSKVAKAHSFFHGSGTVGTDATKRLTLDGNYAHENGVAFRLNAMVHDADVAGRDEVFQNRWGIAPSLAIGLNGPTRATVSFYHLDTDEMPDLGHPMQTGLPAGTIAEPVKVNRNNFYGAVNRDFRITQTDMLTLKLEHDFTDHLRVENITRYAVLWNDYVMTRPTLLPANRSLVVRDFRANRKRNESIINQTNVTGEFNTGALHHTFAAGFEISQEEMRAGNWTNPGNIANTSLLNPDPFTPFNRAAITATPLGAPITTQTKAAYIFDTVKFNEQWSLNAGLRLDDYNVVDQGSNRRNDSLMFNYQVGLVYKPVPYGSFYVSHGTSSNPSGETAGLAGGADGVAAGTLTAANENLDPEKNVSYEIGTKWDILDQRLSLTAALFRTEKTNQRATDPVTGDVALVGNSVANGVEFGASGNITDKWQVFGGYTYIDARLEDDGAGTNDGKRLKFIAPHSFSLWTTYDVTQSFTVGGGAYYMSSRFVNDANTIRLPDHWRFDAMAAYKVNKNVDFQLNVNNIFDATIYDGSHVSLFANVAPGRAATLKANVRF